MKTEIERIWFELANLTRWDLWWEQMEKKKEGEYVRRADVLAVLEKHLTGEQPTAKDALKD